MILHPHRSPPPRHQTELIDQFIFLYTFVLGLVFIRPQRGTLLSAVLRALRSAAGTIIAGTVALLEAGLMAAEVPVTL